MSLHVLICDERSLVSDGLRTLLEGEADVTVVGVTGSGGEAIALTRNQQVDVLLTGLRLRDMSGSEFIQGLREGAAEPHPPIVVYALGDLDQSMADLVRAGANGLLSEDASRAELLMAIRAVASGHAMLGPPVARRMLDWFRRSNEPLGVPYPAVANSLTGREREILLLTAQGMSADDIAGKLFISVATVRTHLYRLRCKLQLRDRAQLVSFAYRTGLARAERPPVTAVPGRP
ncbi:LuxR C-terminal-related transcriptional regulator [Micromonospora zamorensis]|uniref:response regulator transcription factor n=1 Tax=Micromonospora zamorensis TaxID=709883 RepID=UPI003D96D29A